MLKVLLKWSRHFFKHFFYIWTWKYFYCCYRIYICVKNIAIFYVEFTKKWSIFHSKIHKHPAYRMNRDEQGGAGRKFKVLSEHTFWMTLKTFCCNWDLYFNLQSYTFLYQLNGFIPFSPMENIFPLTNS